MVAINYQFRSPHRTGLRAALGRGLYGRGMGNYLAPGELEPEALSTTAQPYLQLFAEKIRDDMQ